ncbi:MAG TPA: glycosyltransferase [Candidatus Eisenbacteria bacterium]
MRILLLSHAPSIHTQRWARALAERGHEVRLLSVVPAPGAAFPGEPIGWAGAPIPFLRYAAARGSVRGVLATWKPDVAVAHFLPNYGFLAALSGARPFVLVAWGSDLLVNARRTPLHAARARWVLGRAALVHVDAENLASAARGLGAAAERVWTRPWGVEAEALAPSLPWRRRREGAGTLRILWNRMLEPLYDPETFLRALASLKREGRAFRATVAGDGPLRPGVEESAARLGLGDLIRFTGRVDEAGMRALYREHEFYVSMSRSDSTSQSLLEAMAAGLYPIVSDIPGNAPWVRGAAGAGEGAGDAGRLVPCGDERRLAEAIAAAADDPGAEARIARGMARVRAEGNWAETVALFEARLAALAREGSR